MMAVLPLTSIYVWLCIVYLVESWNRATPWLFTDELELTQLSRSIATTGHAARRGTPHSFDSLYTYMTAPVWLIHDVAQAYSGVKYLDVFVMASVVFPTYFLARLVVGRGPALFAAAAAAAIPSLAYSSYIVEETLAYPYAALCFFLIAKALVEGRRARRPYGWAIAARDRERDRARGARRARRRSRSRSRSQSSSPSGRASGPDARRTSWTSATGSA